MVFRRRSTRRKAPTLARQLVLLSVFFGIMLMPVGANIATAYQADTAQRLAQDDGDDATDMGDEDTGDDQTGDDQTGDDGTEMMPTEVPMETGMVTVWKGECPIENFDPYQASADQLSANCSSNGAANFSVTDSSGGSPQFGPSGSSFDVLAGNVSISEDLPAGYQQPVVVCQSDMAGTSLPPVSGAAVNIQVNPEEMVVCTFYNVPTGPATLYIYKWECPAGYDPAAQGADPATDCTQAMDGVNFHLVDTDPQTSDLQTLTGDSTPGAVMFGGIPADTYTITEDVPDGYGTPFVWNCAVEPGQNGGAPTPLSTGNVLNLQIAGDTTVTCNWYNVPEEGDGNEVTVYKWDCPVGTDPMGTAEYLQAECDTQHVNIPITLTDANGPHATTTQSDGTTWNNVERETEDVTIEEDIPAGYGDPVVYCWSLLPDETEPEMVTATGGVVSIPDFGDTQWNYYCNWFNIPEGDDTGDEIGAIEIEYRECAPGYTFLDGTNEDDLDQMLMDCAQVNDVEFTIDQGGPDGTSQLTGFYGDSHVSFLEVPIGMRTVTQTVPFATTYVVCEGIVSHGGPETGAMVMPVSNGSIQWDLLDDEIVYCNWFVMPGGETDPTDLMIYKWTCPEGYDPYATGADPLVDCEAGPNGVTFNAEGPNGYSAQTDTGDSTQYAVMFGGLEPGLYTITETPPAGYVGFVWDCSDDAVYGGGSANQMTFEAMGGEVDCNWLNIAAGPTDLIVNKWTCPDGYDVYAASADPYTDCEAGPNGITFTATGPNGYNAQTDTGDSIQYAVMFGGLEPGTYTVTEDVPDGYTSYIWDCYTPVLTFMQADGPIGVGPSWDIQATGGTIHCDWLNVPDEDHEVVLYKWICPDGTMVEDDHDYDWYLENCTTSTDDIQFRLDHSGGSEFAFPSGGVIEWSGIPAGPIGIQEYIPADYEEPVVFCSINDGPWEMYPVTNGYWTYDGFGTETDGSTVFVCHVFNIYGGPGEITVYKWTCPEGYDPTAWGANPYDDCVEGPNGITFTNDGPNGYHSQTDTGDSINYAVYWGGLEPGEYYIEEQVPDGIGWVYVWDCYGQRSGELRPTPLSTNPYITLNLHAGESIICHWLNVPEDPYGTLTVIKFECSTVKFVSEVYCEIYEGGQTFDLAWWNGSAWQVIATNTTDGWGRYTWYGLDAGEYWVDEKGRDWCYMTSTNLSDDGNWLNVYENTETVVKVYNCTGKPGKPGKTPTKYPNTGIPAIVREDWRLSA